jgi:hypothetical protein
MKENPDMVAPMCGVVFKGFRLPYEKRGFGYLLQIPCK